MSQADLLTETTGNRSERTRPDSLAVLIEIPAIAPPSSNGMLKAAQRKPRVQRHHPRRPRRRLRRQVRLAGCALLALVPIGSAFTLGWSNRPDRIVACSIPDPLSSQNTTDDDRITVAVALAREGQPGPSASPGVVVLSVDTPAVAAGTPADAPVIFPGYVLPDDSREDSLHEGS